MTTVGIESPANPRILEAARLRDRKARDDTGLTLVDGARESLRAVGAGVQVEVAFICAELAVSDDAARLLVLLAARGVPPVAIGKRAHDRIAYGNRGDGVVLVVRPAPRTIASLEPGHNALLLVTEDVEKPGNLGAILRTADAAGCSAVIAIGGTDLFNPNVIRASVGTVFSVPVVAAGAVETLAWLREHRIRPIAARVDGNTAHSGADLSGPIAFILGSEADGLSAAWTSDEIDSVFIPMHGVADSLNVSATAAILAFEAMRQRALAHLDAKL
ncbi:MAG: TrmH family RNA methyltransferase [Chloroflexota bacterium]